MAKEHEIGEKGTGDKGKWTGREGNGIGKVKRYKGPETKDNEKGSGDTRHGQDTRSLYKKKGDKAKGKNKRKNYQR